MRAPPHCGISVHVSESEQGVALVTALMGLALFSLLALYLALSATNEVRISDNYEGHLQARYAALSGLHHARVLLRGIDFDDLLRGPDGTNSAALDYIAGARAYTFRNPLDWSLARFVDSISPDSDVSGLPDDGLINTGAYGSIGGTLLIPGSGLPQLDLDGTTVRARYFVKVADNNGETSELAGDSANDPFIDGDGIVLVRSMGIAPTVTEMAGSAVRRNAVVVYEGRFRRTRAFGLQSPLVVQGDDVRPSAEPMFQGSSFLVRGEAGGLGIAGIDVDIANSVSPAAQIRSRVSADQFGNILGDGMPSVGDITGRIASDPERSALLDKSRLWQFLGAAPLFADNMYPADENWATAAIGYYDPALPLNDPSQKPVCTFVGGNLTISGTVSGAGLLVVKGRLVVTGSFNFSGLVLVIGTGEMDLRSDSLDLRGGIYIARIDEELGLLSWGTPAITVGGNTKIYMDPQAIQMALRLIPAEQTGFREVTSTIDP